MSDERKLHAREAEDAVPGTGQSHAARVGSAVAVAVTALRRRLRLFGAVLGATLLLAALVTALQVRRYVATAEVLLQTHGGASATPPSMTEAAARDSTELRVIKSLTVARAVSAALHLEHDAAFVTDEGRGVMDGLLRAFSMRMHAPATTPDTARLVLDRLQTNLRVAPVPGTYALAISFVSVDPHRAADVANAYARAYTAGQPAVSDRPDTRMRPSARLISEAEPPLAAASPRPLANMAVALLLGSLLGLGAALFSERRFSMFSSGSDVQAKLSLSHLGSIPTLASVLPQAMAPLQALADAPLSAFAEAFRSLFLTIRQVGGPNTQVIAITSALPNEGKTTIAACLARSIALANDPVVLIDCDARRRDTSALFDAVATRPGLAQVLGYEATLDEALIRDPASSAWILPLTGEPADLSELLGGAAMGALLEDLRRRFKRIVIDSAPILPIAATRALVTHADLVVIVVRWRRTSSRAVQAALRLLPEKHVRIGGVVLSQIDMNKTRTYDEDDPAFYYKKYEKYYT